MEVVLEGSENVPEGAVLSIKFGDTKRQAPAAKVGQPFRFPGSPADPLPLKVELLVPAAPLQLVNFDAAVERFDVDFGNGVKVNLSQRAASELQRPAVDIGAAAEARGLPAEKLAMAQKAASYLEEHDLVRMFQDILHTLLIAKPEDPHAFVEERMARAKKLAAKQSDPEDAGSPEAAQSSGAAEVEAQPTETQSRSQSGSPKVKKGVASVRENMKAQGALSKVDTLIMTLQNTHEQLPMVLPFLPAHLRESLCCEELAAECEAQFQALDTEGKGTLQPIDMIPVLTRLTQDKLSVIDEEQCKKFVDMFDANEDGVISFNEFTGLVQFVIVAGFLESEEGKQMIEVAQIEENAFQEFISMVEEDKDRLWSIIPFLPDWLVEHVSSDEFLDQALKSFDQLDADGNGTLEPEELIPLIVSLSEAHPLAVDLEKCRRFTTIFDNNGNGVIGRDEFVEYSQFLTVMTYLGQSPDGAAVKQLSEADASRERMSFFINLLENSGAVTSEVMEGLPKGLTKWIRSGDFTASCNEGFERCRSSTAFSGVTWSDTSRMGVEELYPAVSSLVQASPFDVLPDQYGDFAKIYLQAHNIDPAGGIGQGQFPDMAKYVIILAFLYASLENTEMFIADMLNSQDRIYRLLHSLRQGVDKIAEIAPFLPQDLVDDLLSDEFADKCREDFIRLDTDMSGVLEPDEIIPIMEEMTRAHKLSFTEDHCRHFIDIFDAERTGTISEADFVNFSRFMIIMAFMETDEGIEVEIDAEVAKQVSDERSSVETLLEMLEADRNGVKKVIPLLPKHIYDSMVSDEFVTDCNDRFEALDQDRTGVIEHWELLPVVVELSKASPCVVTEDQCRRFTAIFDLHGDGVLRRDEFLDFTRFICIMSYLHTDEGRDEAAGALLILQESKKIEELLEILEEDKNDLSKVIPHLPDDMCSQLMSNEFTLQCLEFFDKLDKDGNGSLDHVELYPVVLALSSANEAALDEEQCKRFTAIFDDEGTGVIGKSEFVNFARFLIIMGYLHNGQESGSGGLEADDVMLKAAELSDKLVPDSRPASKDPTHHPVVVADQSAQESRLLQDALMSTGTDRIVEALVPHSPPHLILPHLAVDAEYYQSKSEKLASENDSLREKLHGLETLMRKMESKMEDQSQRLRHAEVDLRGSGQFR
mmetsp:Transcript_98061/g.211448  ORF Transcript_98061/g.211448 Transcript_98061/m.211448 type:complete len:1157 (-) Transcript_98061:40-3510(-)